MPLCVKTRHELDVPTMMFGTLTFAFDDWVEIATEEAAEYYFASHFAWTEPHLEKYWAAERFHQKWVDKWDSEPSIQVARQFDSIYVICDAIERAGSTDPDKIVDALETTSWESTRGIIEFNLVTGDWDEEPMIIKHFTSSLFLRLSKVSYNSFPISLFSGFKFSGSINFIVAILSLISFSSPHNPPLYWTLFSMSSDSQNTSLGFR